MLGSSGTRGSQAASSESSTPRQTSDADAYANANANTDADADGDTGADADAKTDEMLMPILQRRRELLTPGEMLMSMPMSLKH